MEVKTMPNNKLTPKIVFSEQAYYNMLKLYKSKIADTKEFMFIGVVNKLTNNTYHITDIHLIPQEANSGAFCETDDDRYPAWLHETFPTVEQKQTVRLNGHSHVNMAVEPSGVDNQNIERMMQYVDDFFIQLIINKRQEIKINLWDKEMGLIFNTCPYFIQIGGSLLKVEDSKTGVPTLVKLPELKIENFTNTDDPHIFKHNEIYLDLLTNSTYVVTNLLTFIPNKPVSINISNEEIKEIEEKFNKLLKQPKYIIPTYPRQTSLSDYYYGYDEDDPYMYHGYKDEKPKKKKGGKK